MSATAASLSAPSVPPAPEGYVHAGPVSDFLPLSPTATCGNATDAIKDVDGIANAEANDNEQKNDNNDTTATTLLTGCPAVTPATITQNNGMAGKESGKDNDYLIKVVEIPQPAGRYPPQKRIAVSYFHKKWYAFLNICPHQGSALSRGTMTDIEDMGIIWGAGVTCSLHGWVFDASSGRSDSTRFVIDTFDVKEIDGHVYVSQTPKNAHVAGPRRDFGGREMN